MASKYCLVGNLAKEFKQKLKSGEIDPEKLSRMTSTQRNEFFKSFLGEENAKNVNSLFETTILANNRWAALEKWAKEVAGLKPETQRDLISKINRLKESKGGNLLTPQEEDAFLKDLASTRLGIDVTVQEAGKINSLSNAIDKAKLDAGDFSNPESRIEYGKKLLDMYDYVASLKEGKGFIEQATNIVNVPRALMSTLDFSAPFRQGFGMVTRGNFWKNLGPMIKAGVKEDAFRQIQADIITRPNYISAKKAGLRLTGLGDNLVQREEEFMTTLLDKVPGVRGSERAYTGFLSKLRMDMYDDFINKAELLGEDVRPGGKVSKDIADMINNFTGAGKVGKMEQSVPILNTLFFSPRKIAATVQMMNPQRYLDPRISPTARKEAIKSLIGMVGATSAILTMAKLSGAEVEIDPRSSDFGKVKIGNTRFDVTGGNGSYATLLARLITNQTKTTTTDLVKTLGESYGAPSRGDTLVKFFRNKLAPMSSFVGDWLYGTDAIGNPFNVTDELKTRLIPLSISNAIETATQDPTMAIPSYLADMVGIGTQTYNTNVNWNKGIGKELSQFRDKVGQDKFDALNADYNIAIMKKTEELKKNERYLNLSNEDKFKVITKVKDNEKQKIFKENGFKYKQEVHKKSDIRNINSIAR